MDELDEFLRSEPKDPDAELPAFDNPRPLRWAIPTLALLLTGALIWNERADFAYLAAPSTPVDLGAPGDYHLERLRAGAFAQIIATTGFEASNYRKAFTDMELLPLVDVPIVVDRPQWAPAMNLPHRLPMKLKAVGRLEPEVHRPQFHEVIRYFLDKDQLAPPGARLRTSHVWILADGQSPRGLGLNAAWCALLAALAAFNVAWLWRRLVR